VTGSPSAWLATLGWKRSSSQNWNEKGRDGDTRSPFKQEG